MNKWWECKSKPLFSHGRIALRKVGILSALCCSARRRTTPHARWKKEKIIFTTSFLSPLLSLPLSAPFSGPHTFLVYVSVGRRTRWRTRKRREQENAQDLTYKSYFKSIPFIPFPRRSFPLSRSRSLSIALSFTLSITTLFSSHTVPSLFLSHLSPADTRVANVLLLVVVDVGSEQVAILSTSSSLMTLWLNQYSEWKLIRMIKTVKLSML